MACWIWHWAEGKEVPEYLAEREALADRVAIRQKLLEATDTQINQIKTILGL